MPKRLIACLVYALIVVLAGCGPTQAPRQAQATPEPTPEPTPAPTPTPEAAPQPTPTPEATPQSTPQPTPTPEATPQSTPQPTPTLELTPQPTVTIAAVEPPADWLRIELPHLTLALPPQWLVIGAEDGAERDPAATQTPRFELPPQEQTQLNAVDLNPERMDETGFVTNMRIEMQPETESSDLQQIAEADEQELSTMSQVSELQRVPVQISGTNATQLRWRLQDEPVPGQRRTLVIERYIMVLDNSVYRIDFTTSAGLAETYRIEFDQILGTLRVQE